MQTEDIGSGRLEFDVEGLRRAVGARYFENSAGLLHRVHEPERTPIGQGGLDGFRGNGLIHGDGIHTLQAVVPFTRLDVQVAILTPVKGQRPFAASHDRPHRPFLASLRVKDHHVRPGLHDHRRDGVVGIHVTGGVHIHLVQPSVPGKLPGFGVEARQIRGAIAGNPDESP